MDRATAQRLAVRLGLLVVPSLAYPGNWSSVAPSTPAAQAAWDVDALLVYTSLLVGFLWTATTIHRAVHRVRDEPPWPRHRWLQSVATVLGDRSSRVPFLLASVTYAVFFAVFIDLVSVIPSTPEAVPSFSTILCCGPPGNTPGVILLATPTVQIAVYPDALLLLALGLPLFSANIVVAISVLRRGGSRGATSVVSTAGVLGTLLFNCPSCGTILLANALAGAAGAGALLGWSRLQAPLLAPALPLAIGGLWTSGRQMSRASTCRRPRGSPH